MNELDEQEKGFSSPVEGRGEKLAHVISLLANPLFVAIPTQGIVAFSTAPTALEALLWWMITLIMSIVPFLFIRRGVKLGHLSDAHVSRREQRLVPLLVGIGSVIIALISLLLLHTSRSMIATLSATIIVLSIAAGITKFWTKISFHLIGVAGAVTVFGILFGPLIGFLLAPLILLVGWARWLVRAHTPAQALAGTVLAVSVTITIFWLFGII
jgi:membrane-associated phospholipid phosphatase